jgi:hypothetical protein
MERRRLALPQHATVFIKEPPRFEEDGNVFHASYGSGDAVFSVAFTPHTLLAGIEAAKRAYSEWAARQCALKRLPGKG